jgi:SNF2 family DNA or RNA helicase
VAAGLKYSLLTGKTTNRGEVIRAFQEDPGNYIFLISMKAGGVGLNLTSAGYVFIVDPWWNPAVEEQALSRAHRIGQVQNTFVYRFISGETIEEKIGKLKMRKQSLADRFINRNNPLGTLSQEEVLELIE